MQGQMTIFDYLNQTDDLGEVLRRGSQYSGGKIRIYALYKHEKNRELRKKWLAKEYGMGGRSHQLLNGENGFVDFNVGGIRLYSFHSDYEKRYTWKEAEDRIRTLIDNNMYMTDGEMEKWNALAKHPYPEPAHRYPPDTPLEEEDE